MRLHEVWMSAVRLCTQANQSNQGINARPLPPFGGLEALGPEQTHMYSNTLTTSCRCPKIFLHSFFTLTLVSPLCTALVLSLYVCFSSSDKDCHCRLDSLLAADRLSLLVSVCHSVYELSTYLAANLLFDCKYSLCHTLNPDTALILRRAGFWVSSRGLFRLLLLRNNETVMVDSFKQALALVW